MIDLNFNYDVCVTGACGRGQQYDPDNTTQCIDCDLNFFQDLDYPLATDTCQACPSGTGTAQTGSTSDQCICANTIIFLFLAVIGLFAAIRTCWRQK